jgi:8-oxo-dGTP pyrophosphatase MutT (NUDIX family)
MAKLIYGERIGRDAILTPGCSAIVFDAAREKVLLTRRTDNGRWCLPGGRMDPGESAAETCIREVREETGLEVRVVRLIGIYTSPDHIIEYADGDRSQLVAMSFEAEVIGGEPGLSDETTEIGYFAVADLEGMDLMEHHRERIRDALAARPVAFVR